MFGHFSTICMKGLAIYLLGLSPEAIGRSSSAISCSEKFRKMHRKPPVLESLFNKVASLQASNFTKKRLQHSYFYVNIAKFLRTPILKKNFAKFTEKHLYWSLFSNKVEGCSQPLIYKVRN